MSDVAAVPDVTVVPCVAVMIPGVSVLVSEVAATMHGVVGVPGIAVVCGVAVMLTAVLWLC